MQYWQLNRSRRKTLKRVKAGRRLCGMYSLSAITLGNFISKLGERTDCRTRRDRHPIQKHGLDPILPGPEGKWKVAQGPEIGVEDRGGELSSVDIRSSPHPHRTLNGRVGILGCDVTTHNI